MPCMFNETLTEAQTSKKTEALRDLERQIERGTVTVKQADGRVTFEGWKVDRDGPGHWHDDCAYRTLMAEGSPALRMALSRATPDRMTRQVGR